MALLLESVASLIHAAPKPKPWRNSQMTDRILQVMEEECERPDDFDEIFSKKHFIALYKTGQIQPVIKTQAGATVVAMLRDPKQEQEIPWDLWSQILQLFKRPDGEPYVVYLCAHPAVRTFPKPGARVTPYHINGGYTYPCKSHCVFIFRAEDATRVLIHELFHAACCDNTALHLEQREAETEAWAELFWCGFLSRGDLKTLKSLVAAQSALIRGQNRRLATGHHFAPGPMGFPWRYTIGKEELWAKWGILVPGPTSHVNSMRLTVHPTAAQKRAFGVPATSTIL
jgi:hypothetical protein